MCTPDVGTLQSSFGGVQAHLALCCCMRVDSTFEPELSKNTSCQETCCRDHEGD